MKRLKRWLFRKIDDKYGRLAGALLGLAVLVAVLLLAALFGGVS